MTTQNCAECGTGAEPGQSFCDACGAVLRWNQTGARTPHPAPSPTGQDGGWDAFSRPGPGGTGVPPARRDRTAPASAADAAGERGGTTEETPHLPRPRRPADEQPVDPDERDTDELPRITATPAPSAPAEPAEPAEPGEPAEPAGSPAAPAYTAAPATPAHRPGPPSDDAPSDDALSDRARSLLVPVADPEAARPAPPPAVAPVLPGRPDADRPQVRAPAHHPGIADGPPCPWCSTPNRPDRHYCARCAMPLAQTHDRTGDRPAPWWRRLFGGRRRETPWAGDRPRLRRVFDRIGTWVTVVVTATLAVLGFLYIPDGVQAARDHFAKRAPVSPDAITASRSYPGHKPELLIDKRSNTWWGPGVAESGQGQWIEVSFTEPTRLLDLIITPGVSTKSDKLSESALPHRVKATITLKDGSTTTRALTLDQGAGGQRRPFRVGEVTKVRFTIESAHAASAGKQVAIAEIEFFGPSSANQT
ncbi:NADase-type glycan-binding domain-containing protein [Streptomyces sp. NPDC093586]|uniref:NADase-type glycan-binding domain-containing protein n=1 Tax=Streptomyces sp. NPDC093586 TaxID=3366042 RepID=UPI00382C9A59